MEQQQEKELPVSFSSFIVSLASSAMAHMGHGSAPDASKLPVDLGLARNSIDLLGLLKEKTEGNLDDEEKRLLDALLYELRMKFVDAAKS